MLGFLSRLFGNKETKVEERKEVVRAIVYPIEEDLMKTKSTIENVRTMDDCRHASTSIDLLVGHFETQELRDRLCDLTFKIFLKQYKR
jgi:hypothetical protein